MESVDKPLEALLSARMQHPHIVQTFKHSTRVIGTCLDQSGKKLMETWMVMVGADVRRHVCVYQSEVCVCVCLCVCESAWAWAGAGESRWSRG